MSDLRVTPAVDPVLAKPYYEDESVTIYHADGLLLAGCVRGYPVRLVTDPPYGANAYKTDIAPALDVLSGWIDGLPTVAIFGYPELLAAWCVAMGRKPNEWVTWWPRNKGAVRSSGLPKESEHIAIFGEMFPGRLFRPRSAMPENRKDAAKDGNDPDWALLGDVWCDDSPFVGFNSPKRFHPNEKPLSLMSKLLQICSNPGDLVIDPFAGSGTTLVAAKQLGRRSVGFEIEERYCEIAATRCSQEALDVAV